ncbi:hypothetical protein BDK92_1726 [Micromonospora pisi]|uniref:Uncharacterized protein n=1 Tax=Micromonospora pisi TaxID=589240 RepID=A0A495JEL6_9ACTN|nr:hypothetical protein [Micromonospora pisi]RKR87450.1 hypothetical protein BDK92_1726 [Micromonospora pisi]
MSRVPGERPLVSVGDVLDLSDGLYHHGSRGDLRAGQGELRVRVRALPAGAGEWTGHRVSLTGVRILADGADGAELSLVVHRRALPGWRPAQPQPIPGLVEW